MDYYKIVNVNAPIPVKTTTPPIYGIRMNIKMTYSDILKCLCRRAIIHQVLSDGSTVQLTTKNFRYDFEADLQAKKAKTEPEEKVVVKDAKEKPHVGEYTKADKYRVNATNPENLPNEESNDDDEQPTGSIDDVDMLNDIDDDDNSDADEPEETSTIVTEESTVKEVPTKKQTKTRKKNSKK